MDDEASMDDEENMDDEATGDEDSQSTVRASSIDRRQDRSRSRSTSPVTLGPVCADCAESIRKFLDSITKATLVSYRRIDIRK